ncbi:MAG: hypothetical protein LBC18_00995 [Opitutaceae bacterium]|nr:hypothetical protein [Opitutaceae bacterium]
MHSTSQTIMRRPRRFPAPGLLALALLPALLPAPCARAAIVEWSGSLGLDWTDRGNWANGAGPAAADDAYIRNSGTALINAVDAGTVNRLEVGGQGKDMYGTLDILNGGTLAVFTYAMIGYNGNVQGAAGLGVVTVSGPGSVLMTTGTVNNAIYVGRGSVGVLNILNGGHVKSTGELAIGESNSGLSLGPGLANGSGTITVSGPGSLLEAADANIAKNRAGSLIILDGAEARFSGNVSIGCNQRDPGVVSGEVCVGAGSLIAVTANNKNFTVGGAGNSGGDLGGRSGLLAGTGTVQMFASNINIGITRNGTISAGDRPGEIGTLSIIGGLNLGDIGDAGREKSASMKVDHNAAAADLIRATGAVIFGDILNVDLSSLASVTGIPIVTAGGNITDALPGTLRFTINGAAFSTLDRLAGALPAASLSISGSQLLMTINSTAANKHLVWTGAADNAWNLTGANWREDGGGAIAFLTGDAVTFATLGGVATATVTAGVGQIVSQLALAGDTSYTLAADLTADGSQARALATGTSGKLLLGAAGAPFNATLTLAGNNSFLGGVTLATGTLSVATVRNLGAALAGVTFVGAGAAVPTLLITDDITFDSAAASGEPAGWDELAIAAGATGVIQMAPG